VTDSYWRVVVDERARKDLRRIDPQPRQRILRAITRLAAGAELAGDIKRLTGSGEYRLRVGDWRVGSSATIGNS
jgi:mRNA-degrading endonuclease RelE of RelBE toxin-antitoxin system